MGSFGDPFRFIERVQKAPLASSRQLGRFSLRDVLVAKGEIPAATDSRPPESGVIDGAFADTPPRIFRPCLMLQAKPPSTRNGSTLFSMSGWDWGGRLTSRHFWVC
jgi:hypothetical protein